VKHIFLLVLVFVTVASLYRPAFSACVSGQPASYSDIVAVMFARHGCGGLVRPKRFPLKCSSYYVFFWNINPTGTYTQYDAPSDSQSGRGTYKLDTTLQQAVNLLQKNDFFLLNPGEHQLSDISETVVTVRRCGVVTRLMMYPLAEFDPKVNALFADFDALVQHAKKDKTSDTPEDFQYTGLF